MTDSTVLSEPMPESSTVIEPRGHDADPAQSAHKEPNDTPEPKEEKPAAKESRLDTIKRAAAELEKQNKEPAKEPVKEETKAEDGDEKLAREGDEVEKQAKARLDAEQEEKTKRQLRSERLAPPPPPPARFQHVAKEKWGNVPQEVKGEVHRVIQEFERQAETYKEAQTFREELREYEDMAKTHGTTVKQSLDNYVAIERKFAEDPAQGFRQLMSNLQMSPPQAISHILRAYGVTPQQLAAHMQQSPTEYTALAQPRQAPQMQQPQQQAAQQADPRVQKLEERLQSMEADRVANTVIAPFAQEYPEYYQHEGQIAEVLKSGIIERIHGQGLGPQEKLYAALLMVNPSVGAKSKAVHEEEAENLPVADLRGTKSVKGAPTPGTDASGRRNKSMSRTEAIAAAAAELGVRL